jgi:phage terminase Nu1 subunit (DNA packaging protein)
MRHVLTKSEFAEELHVSCPRVSQFVKRGLPVRRDGRVDLERACAWVVENIDPWGEGSVARSHANEWLWLLRRRTSYDDGGSS